MNKHFNRMWKINQLFIFIASFSVVFVIMKFASDLLVPLLISIVVTIILNPILVFFEKRHIPKMVSMMVIVLISLLPVIVLAEYTASEVKLFTGNFHEINKEFEHTMQDYTSVLEKFDITVDQNILHKVMEKSNLSDIFKQLASQASSQFSNIFLIFFTVAFMLMEMESLHDKMVKIAKENNRDANEWLEIVKKIKSYFLIKVKTSLLTAVWVYAVLWYYDVSYAFLWVVLVFFLNFVPVIGSILAAIPAIIMAGVDHGGMIAMWVMSWYLVINTVVGNILEPKIMGKGLGLSALVVFLSMTFWGWVFGPAGMILSVPLTMVLQFMFEQYDETKWISLYLSDYEKGKKDGKNNDASRT